MLYGGERRVLHLETPSTIYQVGDTPVSSWGLTNIYNLLNASLSATRATRMDKNIINISDLAEIATIAIENGHMEYKGKKAGSFYRIYGYAGKRFALPEEHAFNKAFDNSKDLTLVKLEDKSYERTVVKVDEEGNETETQETRQAWELVGFCTRGETLNNKLFEVKLKAIDKLADVDNMSQETLASVLSASV